MRRNAGIARFTVKLPDNVMAPLSGSMFPVKSEFAIGEMFTSVATGVVMCTVKGLNVAPACGNDSAPAPVTVPFDSVPVIGPNAPSAVVSEPSVNVSVTLPGFLTVAPAPSMLHGNAIASTTIADRINTQ